MSPVLRLEDFGGGIWRDRRGPRGYVQDAIDAIVEETDLLRRGGTSYLSTAAPDWPTGVADAYVYAGQRLITWRETHFDVLNADDSTWSTLAPGAQYYPAPGRRAVGVGPYLVVPRRDGGFVAWAGSRRNGIYTTGTVSGTAGQRTLTGSGTSWLTNAQRGDIIVISSHDKRYIVAKVVSDTQITLREELDHSPAGTPYSLGPLDGLPAGAMDIVTWPPVGGPSPETCYVAAVGSPAKLVLCLNDRAYMSEPGDPFTFKGVDGARTEYHELPPNVRILGADAMRDNVFFFTTGGVWVATNVDMDLTDEAGNPQQQLHQASRDVILWGEAGIAGWASQLVVPALDDVYLFSPDGAPAPISPGIRSLYRSYVKAGYQPGMATIYRGHYLLPILNEFFGVIDHLVCRLDQRDSRGNMRPAWTRWSGHAAANAWTVRVPLAAGSVGPRLLGTKRDRVIEATSCFTPTAANKSDADGTTANLDITTNDIDTGPGNKNTVLRARLAYELVDAAADNPTLAASYAIDAQEGAALTGLAGTAPEDDGSNPKSWPITKRARRIRIRLLSSGPAATLRLRSLDLFTRPSNRP